MIWRSRSVGFKLGSVSLLIFSIALAAQLTAVRLIMSAAVQKSRERTTLLVHKVFDVAAHDPAFEDHLSASLGGFEELAVGIYDDEGQLLRRTAEDVELPSQLSGDLLARGLEARNAPWLIVPEANFLHAVLSMDGVGRVESTRGTRILFLRETWFPRYHAYVRSLIVLMVIIFTPVVTFFGTLVVAGRIRKGLQQAASVVHAIASGDLDRRVPVTSDDEIGSLARDFNRMAERTQALVEQLRREKELKERLFADWTHEVATPLSSVLGYLEALNGDMVADEATRRRYVDTAYRQALALESLRSDLEILSRADTEGLILEKSSVDLATLVAQEVEALVPLAKEIELRCTFEQKPVVVEVDERRLKQAVRNLVTNAIVHGKKSPIELTLRDGGDSVTLAVRDFGAGIAPEHLGKLSERFYRPDSSRARDSGGRGLGLSITRALVEAHGGRLEISSELGVGTTSTIHLKKSAPPGPSIAVIG